MVRSTLTRWEWKISLVFGRRFASRLIAGATCDKRQDSMTWDNLMAVKRTISEKTGYFIDFTEST
jgi:hypothetical protein